MEKRTRRFYDAAFKAGAVKLVKEGGRTAAQAARDLGIGATRMGAWLKEAENEAGPAGSGPLKAAERDELAALRKENRILKMERDLLKKATAFFARENS
jgi:transposase